MINPAFFLFDHLELLDEAAEGARQSSAVPRGHLRITAPHDLDFEVLPDSWSAFALTNPK